jgi:hypothetical protein
MDSKCVILLRYGYGQPRQQRDFPVLKGFDRNVKNTNAYFGDLQGTTVFDTYKEAKEAFSMIRDPLHVVTHDDVEPFKTSPHYGLCNVVQSMLTQFHDIEGAVPWINASLLLLRLDDAGFDPENLKMHPSYVARRCLVGVPQANMLTLRW